MFAHTLALSVSGMPCGLLSELSLWSKARRAREPTEARCHGLFQPLVEASGVQAPLLSSSDGREIELKFATTTDRRKEVGQTDDATLICGNRKLCQKKAPKNGHQPLATPGP